MVVSSFFLWHLGSLMLIWKSKRDFFRPSQLHDWGYCSNSHQELLFTPYFKAQWLIGVKHLLKNNCSSPEYQKKGSFVALLRMAFDLSWVINGWWHQFGFSDRLLSKVIFRPYMTYSALQSCTTAKIKANVRKPNWCHHPLITQLTSTLTNLLFPYETRLNLDPM